jgi:glycosyltransferase involved in cell wall biosynthesis
LSDSLDVLIVIGGLSVGGAERHVSSVTRALARTGWSIGVYSLAGEGALQAEISAAGVRVIQPPVNQGSFGRLPIFRPLWTFIIAIHLIYTMLKTQPRIVHFFLPAAYMIGAVAAWIARIPIRIMSRRSLNNYQQGYPAARWLESKLHRTMDAILGNSMAVVRQLRDDEGVPESKLGLIYNGIEAVQASHDRSAVRSSLMIDDRTLVFVIVANLIPYKGHLDLLEAFSLANDRIGQPWRLLIVGRDDGIGSELGAAAGRLNIDGNVSFLGLRSDAASLMSASDVGLLSSHQEGFSNTILEGMAAGLPMIVTNVGGNAEAVADGETGLVVPPHDPAAFADAIVRVARDPALRDRYGAAGRERVGALFSSDTCVTKYQALYRGLMRGEAPGDIPEVRTSL